MKNIVLEELNRVKLLMSYDSKNTLSENIEIIKLVESKKIISEQTGKALLKSILGTSDEAAGLALKSTSNAKYVAGVELFNDVAIYGKTGLSSGDEIMTALIRNTLTKAQLSELAKGLMKSGKALGTLRTTLTNKAADLAVKDVRYANMTQKQFKTALTKKGYDPAIADEIAGKFAKNKGLTPNVNPTSTGINPLSSTKVGGKALKYFNKVKAFYGSSKAFRWLVVGGLGYLAYKLFMTEGSSPFPDCIRKKITEEEFIKQNGEKSDGSLLISDTGIEAIDTVGGGKFYDNKDFKSGNGKYSGTWEDVPGVGVVITIGGNQYTMPCEGIVPDDICPEGQTWDGEKCVTDGLNPNPTPWVNCTSLPYKKGCKNDDIKKIQDCLGITPDGKYGSETEKALKSKGYDVTITQEIYDEIMDNCGITTTTTTIWTPDRNEIGSDELGN